MTIFTQGTRVRIKDNYPVTMSTTDELDAALHGKVHVVSEFVDPYYLTQPEDSDPLPYAHHFLPEELEAV